MGKPGVRQLGRDRLAANLAGLAVAGGVDKDHHIGAAHDFSSLWGKLMELDDFNSLRRELSHYFIGRPPG